MKNNKKLFLVHASMDKVTLPKESVNVMLTPQFYTIKREEFPLKYAYQAKKIAPSLFEGLLEDGGNYEYAVTKEGDNWVFIAYDTDKISDFLAYKGIPIEKVSKVFFAQQAVDSFAKAPLKLSEKETLSVIDNTVVVMPSGALSEGEPASLGFNNSFTPKEGGVSIKGVSTDSLLSEQQAIFLVAIFILFGGIFIVEGLRYNGDIKAEEEEIQALYKEYPALESSYTREGIINKYKTLDTIERKKRDVVKIFSRMIFKGVTITSLNVTEKGFKAQFACADTKVLKRLQSLAKKEHYNTSKISGSNTLLIEGTL